MSASFLQARLQTLQNCEYAVSLGRKIGFILVGIDGNDINKGNKLLTLALGTYTYTLNPVEVGIKKFLVSSALNLLFILLSPLRNRTPDRPNDTFSILAIF